MPPASFPPGSPLGLSVIVPFHRNLAQLRQCLEAIQLAARALPGTLRLADFLVVADGAIDDPRVVASQFGATVLAIAGPNGPAVARTRGSLEASGDVLVFIDTDVVVDARALERLGGLFLSDPELGAAFGAYDEYPADAGFFSQCRNLAHAFIHQRGNTDAQTFWGGLGGVRRRVFASVGGFDPRFPRPSVEDIDLGYRICAAGHRIVLDPTIQGKHLKRWTLRSSILTDVRDRGIPWTQLLNRYRPEGNDLNITRAYRACVVIAYLIVLALMMSVRWPATLTIVAAGLAALWFLDRPYYRFFIARRGWLFTLRWFPFHVVHHLCNGVSFVVGTVLYAARRLTGLALPGALPLTAWDTAALISPEGSASVRR
jgi:GT2 family glycosyltransferase